MCAALKDAFRRRGGNLNGATQADGSIQIAAKGEAALAAMRALADHPWRRYLAGQAAYEARSASPRAARRSCCSRRCRGDQRAAGAAAKRPARRCPSGSRSPRRPAEGEARRVVPRTSSGAARARRWSCSAPRCLTPAGEAPLTLPERPGTLVYGSLPALDLDKWLPLSPGPERRTRAPSTCASAGSTCTASGSTM